MQDVRTPKIRHSEITPLVAGRGKMGEGAVNRFLEHDLA